MDKNLQTNPMVTVAQSVGGDAKGPRPGAAPPPQGGGLPNISVIIRRTFTHWTIAAVVMALGALATAQVVRFRKPVYKSETVIFYRPGVSAEGAPATDLRTLGTKLKEILFAQSNLKKILDETQLFADVIEKRGYPDAVDQFRKQIDFKARSNDTFAISYAGKSREEAQSVTARLADMIVDENRKAREDRAKETTEFIEAEKKRVDEDLSRLEKDLAAFMTDHPEFVEDNAGRPGAAVRAQQKKVDAAVASDRAAVRRRALAAAGAVVGRTPAGETPRPTGALGGPPVDPVLLASRTQAMNELIAAKKDLGEKSVKFTEAHPDVKAAATRVAAAEAALQKAEEAILAAQPPAAPPPPVAVNLPDPYEDKTAKPAPKGPVVARTGPAESKPPAPTPSSEASLVALETEWSRLNREVAKVQQQQTQLEKQLFQAEMAASSEIGGYAATIVILDPAFKPAGPSGAPNRTIVLAGFVASLLAGVAMAAARGVLFDDRLYDPSEIDGLGLVPVLGVVPKVQTTKPKSRGLRG